MDLNVKYSSESEFIVVSARDRLFNNETVDFPFIHVFNENDIELSSSELDVDDNDTQIESRINDCTSYPTFKSGLDNQLIDDMSVSLIMKEFDFEVELQQQWKQTLIIDNYMQNQIKSKDNQSEMYSEKQSSTNKGIIHYIDDNTVFESSAAELYSLIEHTSTHTNINTFGNAIEYGFYSFAEYYTKNEIYANDAMLDKSYSTDFQPWIFVCALIAMMFVNALFTEISPKWQQSNINSTVVYLREDNDFGEIHHYSSYMYNDHRYGSTILLDNYKMMNDDLVYDDIWNQLFVDIVSVYRDTHTSSLIQAYSQYIMLLQQCYLSLMSTSTFALFPSASNSVSHSKIESSFWQCGECQTNGSLRRNSLQCSERTVDDVIFCKHILSNATFIDFLCLQFDCSKMNNNEIGSDSNQNKCWMHTPPSLVSASVMISEYTLFAWFVSCASFISSLIN